MLVLTLRDFNKSNKYIEVVHSSGDVLRVCITKICGLNIEVGFDGKKEEFEIQRKKIHADVNYNK